MRKRGEGREWESKMNRDREKDRWREEVRKLDKEEKEEINLGMLGKIASKVDMLTFKPTITITQTNTRHKHTLIRVCTP